MYARTGSPEPAEAAEVFFISRKDSRKLDFEIDRRALEDFYQKKK